MAGRFRCDPHGRAVLEKAAQVAKPGEHLTNADVVEGEVHAAVSLSMPLSGEVGLCVFIAVR